MLSRLRLIKTFSRRKYSTKLHTKSREELLEMVQKIESDNDLTRKLEKLGYRFPKFTPVNIYNVTKYCCGTRIPPEIGLLTNLEELIISTERCGNTTLYFPPEIGKLTKLKKIEFFRGNSFREDKVRQIVFPEEIKNLVNLEILDLAFLGLTEIPKEIGLLKKLKVLRLSGNEITSLPKEIGDLEFLEKLYINSNKFETFPKEIYKLSNLKKLNLGKNNLTTIPNEINKMESLINIDFGQNSITDIPEELFSLTKLEKLDLRENKLTTIPDKIENFKNLEYLNISHNNIQKLPKTLMNIGKPSLEPAYYHTSIKFNKTSIDFYGNNITNICVFLE